MSAYVNEAKPLSRRSLRATADVVRRVASDRMGFAGPYFPIMEFIENVLPELDPDFCFVVGTMSEMGADHGLTIPSRHLIKLREDVYDGACEGRGRDRGTAAHELGHYILHDDKAFPRRMKESDLPAYRSAEWQAKAFAGELLVPPRFIQTLDDEADVALKCGVSLDSAGYQLSLYKKEGLIIGSGN